MKRKKWEALNVATDEYYCPHFKRVVNHCTCHERPVYQVLDPAELRELRREHHLLLQETRLALRLLQKPKNPHAHREGAITVLTRAVERATRKGKR